MGTNYYHRTNICAHCGRHDEPVHIGKSGYMLHALTEQVPHTAFDALNRPIGPLMVRVLVPTWAAWKDRLRSMPGDVVNEYGDVQTVDEFIAWMEAARTDDPPRGVDARVAAVESSAAHADVLLAAVPEIGATFPDWWHQANGRRSWIDPDPVGPFYIGAYEFS